MTPYFETELGKLYHADCLEIMPMLEPVDLVLTDPPYGTTACSWDSIIPLELMWSQLNSIKKTNTPICLFGNEPFSTKLRISNFKEYRYDWYIKKNYPSGINFSKYQPMRTIENVIVFYSKPPTFNKQMIDCAPSVKERWHDGEIMKLDSQLRGSRDHQIKNDYKRPVNYKVSPTNFIEFKWPARAKGYLHPTQKPALLMEYMVKTYSTEADTVLDFTIGSGTTAVACERLNRRWIGIEIEEKYCEIAAKRIEKENQQLKLFT